LSASEKSSEAAMGQYIQIGVCTEVRVAKAHLERSKLSLVELREALQEELGLHLFDEEETEAEHVWRIKPRPSWSPWRPVRALRRYTR
jgi:hypothetical protein